jgi:hypothetical protein
MALPGVAARPNFEKCTDSRAQGGDKACEGGGRRHHHVEGGGVKKRLTFPGIENAGDVELGSLFFFGLVTKMASRLLWTPPYIQVNPLILFAFPLDHSSQTHSSGLRLIVDSAGTLPYCSHSVHLRAFALAHPSTDSFSSSCYDSLWHPESLPASIVTMSCRQSFSLPSFLQVWAKWINQACFQ